jgi:hypothetical protein
LKNQRIPRQLQTMVKNYKEEIGNILLNNGTVIGIKIKIKCI